jgi:hypothetical protein
MWATLLLIGFLAFMVYWYGFVQGFFSAFLHLMVVIVSGSIALAFWEPIAQGMLYNMMGGQAWGAALVFPFVTLLLALRLIMDRLVPDNMDFSKLTNMIGGGICGLFSGILSAGLLIIGMGFMGFSSNLGGYQPLVVNDDNSIHGSPGQGIVGNAVVTTAGFYNMLSGGAFSSGHPLSLYLPDLAKQAAMYRVRTDDANASIAAGPNAVTITGGKYFISDTDIPADPYFKFALKQRPDQKPEDKQLVCIDTQWTNGKDPHTFDGDNTLRVQSSQVRLVVWSQGSRVDAQSLAPIGYSRLVKPATGERHYHCFSLKKMSKSANNANPDQRIAWFFLLPKDYKPKFLMTRRLRLPVPVKSSDDPDEMVQLIGDWKDAIPTEDMDTGGLDPALYQKLEITSRLPVNLSRNFATGMKFSGKSILNGHKFMPKPPRYPSPAVRIETVYTPSHTALVRIRMSYEKLRDMFGETEASPNRKKSFWLEGRSGQKWYSIGYVLFKVNRSIRINIDRSLIKTGEGLPMDNIGRGDEFYLYIPVPRGVTIQWYKIGDNSPNASPKPSAKMVPNGYVPPQGQRAAGAIKDVKQIIVEATNELPTPVDPTAFEGSIKTYRGSKSGKGIEKTSDEVVVIKPKNDLSGSGAVYVWSDRNKPLVRVMMTNDQALMLFGKALAGNKTRGTLAVVDSLGRTFSPVAYVLEQLNETMRIAVRHRTEEGLQFQHLPLSQMADGDKLYVYFEVQAQSATMIKKMVFSPSLGDEVRLEIKYKRK